MKHTITVAAVQMTIVANDMAANIKKAEEMTAKLFATKKCDLVVFPEDCLSSPTPYHVDVTQDENSEEITTFQNLARKYHTYIVCGSFTEKIGSKRFNTSLLLNPKGEIILKYQKNHLWIPERSYLTPGTQVRVVKTPIGTIGIMICWDLANPEIAREMAKQRVDIICCPSYWTKDDGGMLPKKYDTDSEKTFVNIMCPATAIENEVLLIYVNGAGAAIASANNHDIKSKQIGQSQICVPILGTVAKINDNSEDFITYEYNQQIAKDAESVYKLRADLLTS